MTNPAGYIERGVDAELWNVAIDWFIGQKAFQWVSLSTAPGRGNTAVLEHFLARAREDRYRLAEAEPIYVAAREIYQRSPIAPSDLAEALARYHDRDQGLPGYWKRIWRCSLWRKLAIAVSALVITILIASLFAFENYAGNAPPVTHANWRTFLIQFWAWLPENSERVVLLIAIAATLAGLWLMLSKLVPRPMHAMPDEIGRTPEALLQLIHAAAHNKHGVILAVDNAIHLSDVDRKTLHDLGERRPIAVRPSARHLPPILLITVDTEADGTTALIQAGLQPKLVKVESLSDADLTSMILTRWPRTGSADLVTKLQQARESLRTVFTDEEQAARIQRVNNALTQRKDINIAFGVYKTIVFWSVRHMTRLECSELYAWLADFDNAFLKMFGWREPDAQRIVDELSTSIIAERDGEQLYFDREACAAVVAWARGHEPTLLLKAHVYWGLTLGDAALAQPSQDPVAAARLREAGWQLAHVSSLLGETPLVDLFRRFPAPPADQSALFVKAASILVASARTRLEEGEFSEADDLIADSAEWLAGAGTPPDDVLEETSRLSWNLYWYTGDAANWSRVEEFGTRYPAIAAGALWKAHAALRHSLRCETTADEVTAMAQDSPDPDVANINGIAYVLSQSRIETGFLAASFKAGSLVVRDAAPARYFSWAEFQIRQLQIKQILLRADLPHARALLLAYRDRLLSSSRSSTVVDEVFHAFDRGQYLHLLLWFDDLIDEKLTGADDLLAGFDVGAIAGDDLRARVKRDCETLYEGVVHDTSLLKMKPLLAEATFQLGELQRQHGSGAVQSETGWKVWEHWFDVSLSIDDDLRWRFRAPAVHHARWDYFRLLDHSTALTDAYNTLGSIMRANFPSAVILEWHLLVSAELNNFGDSADDRKRSAELHELWARRLCLLPEAMPYRDYKKSIALEQANSLIFAAQAYRHVHDLPRADRVLAEAESLHQAAVDETKGGQGESEANVRNVHLTIRLQRFWIEEEKDETNVERPLRLLMQLWADIRFEDATFCNVLASLLKWERRKKQLAEPWPSDGALPHVDPDSAPLSLPADWPNVASNVLVTRFDFRLLQLIRSAALDAPFGSNEFALAAIWGLRSQKEFAKTAIRFGEMELAEHVCSPPNRAALRQLLRNARIYFNRIQAEDTMEMSALRCLMRLDPDDPQYRISYASLALKHAELLERELHLQPAASIDVFSVVTQVHSYLGALVDDAADVEHFATRLAHRGLAGDEAAAWTRRMLAAISEARRSIQSDPAHAKAVLRPFLPQDGDGWMTFPDLEMLHLSFHASVAIGAEAEARALSRQLQLAAVRYVSQYTRTIREKEIQQLAYRIVDVLQNKLMSAAPVAA